MRHLRALGLRICRKTGWKLSLKKVGSCVFSRIGVRRAQVITCTTRAAANPRRHSRSSWMRFVFVGEIDAQRSRCHLFTPFMRMGGQIAQSGAYPITDTKVAWSHARAGTLNRVSSELLPDARTLDFQHTAARSRWAQ